jgi:hypothetical protein
MIDRMQEEAILSYVSYIRDVKKRYKRDMKEM